MTESDYSGWLAARTYRIVRSTHPEAGVFETKVEVEGKGLSYEAAKTLCAEMQGKEDKLHPGRTSWSKDIFHLEMEGKKWGAEHA